MIFGSRAIWPVVRPSVTDTKKTIAPDALGIQCHQLSARFYFLVVYKKNGRDIYRESECWPSRCENKLNSWCIRSKRPTDGSRRRCKDWTSNGQAPTDNKRGSNNVAWIINKKLIVPTLLGSIWVDGARFRSPCPRNRFHFDRLTRARDEEDGSTH